jgi:rare lipoprotein A
MTHLLLALHLATAPYTAGPHISVPQAATAPRERVTRTEHGVASVYGSCQRTAWGGWYDMSGWVTAHKTAPRGTVLLVTCLATGLSKHVVVCDRGPYVRGRIVDISPATARAIGLPGSGNQRLGRVRVEWVR